MKYLRTFCVAAALTFALAQSAVAEDGIIHGGIAPPPGAPETVTQPTEANTTEETPVDTTVEITLDLLSSLFSLAT